MAASQNPKITCRARFRIKLGDVIALGPGKIDLLEAIGRTGSISAAGRDLGLSYRRAWDMVDTMNTCFKKPVVERFKGGQGGGGADLTDLGRALIQRYRHMEDKAGKAAARDWQAILRELKTSE